MSIVLGCLRMPRTGAEAEGTADEARPLLGYTASSEPQADRRGTAARRVRPKEGKGPTGERNRASFWVHRYKGSSRRCFADDTMQNS